MRSLVRTTMLAVLLASGSAFGAQVSIGIRIGPPPPPRVVRVLPPRPGPEFVWVEGYWYPVRRRYRWHEGYWTRPPYAQARWVSPRYEGEQFYGGYWEGERGRFEHDHRWDRERDRESTVDGNGTATTSATATTTTTTANSCARDLSARDLDLEPVVCDLKSVLCNLKSPELAQW